MNTFTDKEIAVIRSLANNYYGNEGDGVWSDCINQSNTPSGLTDTSLPGVVASLVKKGVITSEEYEKNRSVIWVTKAGAEILKNYVE